MSKSQFYDASPELARAVQEKATQRALRKAEYVKMMSDPYLGITGAVPVDMGIERFEAQRTFVGSYRFFKPTVRTFTWYMLGIWAPILGFTYLTVHVKRKREHTYRTGQVAYRDRHERFM